VQNSRPSEINGLLLEINQLILLEYKSNDCFCEIIDCFYSTGKNFPKFILKTHSTLTRLELLHVIFVQFFKHGVLPTKYNFM